jgi:hypothetical protein
MKKLLLILLLTFSFASTINLESSVEPTIRIRPSYTIGKMTNGNWYTEIMPLRIAWTPIPEWEFGVGYSMGFESPRGAFSLMGNHRGWATRVKAQYKPLNFLKHIFPDTTLQDFAVSYTKQISGWYDGYSLDVGRLNYEDWEEISVGFDFNL